MPEPGLCMDDSVDAMDPLSSLSSTDISLPFSSLSSTSQEKQSPSPTETPHNIRPNTLNTGQDAYWFAHAADPPQDRVTSRHNHTLSAEQDDQIDPSAGQRLEDDKSNETESNLANRNLHRNRTLVSPTQSECKEDSSPASQKEREERFRLFKEKQEEERQRRLTDLQQQSIAAQRFREMQEDERRRRIEELRQKDFERRIAVEERKRQIWEAEQERKEAILRRNLEREAKIEARRNAQRNSMSFAFGSSTPRVIDLDLGGFKLAGPPFSPVPSALNGRRTPSGGLDQKTDEVDGFEPGVLGSRDMDSLTKEKQLNRRSYAGMSSEATKACLTITPENNPSSNFYSPNRHTTYNDLQSNTTVSWLIGSGRVFGGEDLMSRSMVILPSSRGRRKTDLTPTLPWERDVSQRSQSPASSIGGMSASKRAVSMSRLDILAQPRRRYVVDHSPSSSNIASSNSQGVMSGSTGGSLSANNGPRTTSSKLRKDSPSRPRSSMSGTSEQSVTSTVSMRSQSGPRRPRPVSMVGAIPDSSQHAPTPPQRQSRTAEKRTALAGAPPPTRPPRAKSVGPDSLPPPKPPPRKPSSGKSPKPAPVEKPIASVQPNSFEPVIPATAADDKMDDSVELEKLPGVPTETVESHQEAKLPVKENVVKEATPPAKDIPTEVTPPSGKPRITSEEEAKAALAEKRRLAREQAEKEAELERLRQEEIKRKEEERRLAEEEEQRRFEEEQMRLAEELRKQEEEKLAKAIQEQAEREAEEQKRLEEEVKAKAEKEEQDRKARDEAEKQRKELEEKLRKEEEERAERKRRVEQIMKRTRAKNAAASSQDGGENLSGNELSVVSSGSPVRPSIPPPAIPVNGQPKEEENVAVHKVEAEITQESSTPELNETNVPSQDSEVVAKANELLVPASETKPILESEQQEQKVLNGYEGPLEPVKKIIDSEAVKSEALIHTNGFSSSSPESISESPSEGKVDHLAGNLLDFDSIPEGQTLLVSSTSPSIEFDQIIDLNTAATTTNTIASNQNEVHLINAVDDVNSNCMVPNNPFIAFEESISKKQPEASFTDLLS